MCLCVFPFDVSDGRCGIIVSIPDHCLPFYFYTSSESKIKLSNFFRRIAFPMNFDFFYPLFFNFSLSVT